MKIGQLILGAAVAIAAILQPAEAGFIDSIKGFFWRQEMPPPTIKVLVLHDQPGALVEVKGKYQVYDPHTMERLSKGSFPKRQYIQGLNTGIKWGEEFPGVHQLLIVPDDFTIPVTIDGNSYVGSLYVYDIGGTVSIVNELPIEDYLMAILTPSFNPELPPEALASIAIAARTQAYYASKYPKNKYWAVDGSKVGFNGMENIRLGSIAQAINATQDMVLSRTGVYEGVTPFPAQWGSMTGGKPQNEETVFARITLFDVEALANKGENAAQILSKAFPQSAVVLIQP